MGQLRDHIINQISSSPLITDPFGHKFIENIFPKNYYQNLLSHLPSKSHYISIKKTGSVPSDYSPERYIFNLLDKEHMDKLNQEKKSFFSELINILLSKELFLSVTSNFSQIIDNRLNNLSELEKQKLGTKNFNFSIRTALVKDYTKYNLGVHTDTVGKLMSFLFYIPENDTLSNIGTSLYKSVSKINSDTKQDLVEDQHFTKDQTKKNFKKIKTCPFIPNSLFLFPRTRLSFHGVEEVNIDQKERNLLLLNYFINKGNK